MILTNEQAREMLETAKPLMRWISDNCHPHCAVMVEAVRVELTECIAWTMPEPDGIRMVCANDQAQLRSEAE